MPRPRSSAGQPRTPRLPKPGTPELCPACRARGESLSLGECRHILTRPAPRRGAEVKGRGGRPKEIDSSGRYCPNPRCEYFAIMDAAIYAIVADGIWAKTVRFRTGSVRRVGVTPATASARFCIG